jgi:hypothetical protein
MTDGALRGSGWGRALARTSAWLVLGGLLLGLSYSANVLAQKKTDPKKSDVQKTDKKPAPKKPGPKKPDAKPVVDVLATDDGAAQVAYINEELQKQWKENKITPSERCTDYEFIRRASLDLIGRIATPEEITRFMKDKPEKRRSLLIERLMGSSDFEKNWANIWTVWLMTRSGALSPATRLYHEQMKVWLEEQFADKDMQYDKMVTALLTATGKTNENQAVNFILAHLGEPIKEDQADNGKYEMVPLTARTTRLFLGLRTQCTQCHDHPFNDEWKQSHFWGINAFFRQVDAPKGRPRGNNRRAMVAGVLELTDDKNLNPEGVIYFERRNGVVLPTKPVFLDGTKMPALKKGSSRRKELAKFIVKSDYFAKAYVNRMWGHFFGRGFTKVVDDFGEHNPISHPELLDKLGADFVKYQYKPRDLIRWICNSKAYGLSSASNETNDKEDAEPYFGRMLLKAMSPEQLFDSLMVATKAEVAESKENRQKLRDAWMNKLVVNFGDDEGNEATFNGTVVQALLLMNGPEINKAIMDTNKGTVAAVLKTRGINLKTAMAKLYMAALNRPPTPKENAKILNPAMIRLPRVPSRADFKFFTAFYQDLFWALLNSNEFILNH